MSEWVKPTKDERKFIDDKLVREYRSKRKASMWIAIVSFCLMLVMFVAAALSSNPLVMAVCVFFGAILIFAAFMGLVGALVHTMDIKHMCGLNLTVCHTQVSMIYNRVNKGSLCVRGRGIDRKLYIDCNSQVQCGDNILVVRNDDFIMMTLIMDKKEQG